MFSRVSGHIRVLCLNKIWEYQWMLCTTVDHWPKVKELRFFFLFMLFGPMVNCCGKQPLVLPNLVLVKHSLVYMYPIISRRCTRQIKAFL